MQGLEDTKQGVDRKDNMIEETEEVNHQTEHVGGKTGIILIVDDEIEIGVEEKVTKVI